MGWGVGGAGSMKVERWGGGVAVPVVPSMPPPNHNILTPPLFCLLLGVHHCVAHASITV